MGSNLLATLALLGFVPFAIVVFGRLPRVWAAAVVVLSGSLLLPERVAFDFPGLPALDKEYITYLGALIGALVHQSRWVVGARPGLGPEALIGVVLLANVATALTNQDSTLDDGHLNPPATMWDIVAWTGDDVLQFALPFFVGRALFRARSDVRVLLKVLVMAGLVYAGLIAVEVLLSIPFGAFLLAGKIYGSVGMTDWRYGTIQPVVFMDNGLSIATFMVCTVLAAIAVVRTRMRGLPLKPRVAYGILLAALVMVKNVAGIVYGISMSLAIALLRPRIVATAALALSIFICVYPALRVSGLFPWRQIIEVAAEVDPTRARSLEGRFEEEEHVVSSAGEHFLLGWGTYLRIPGLLDREGGGTGAAGLDGYWIIQLGTHGILGLELRLALLMVPVTVAWRRQRLLGSHPDRVLLVALMAIVAVRGADLLINAWWNSLPAFLAGALYGVATSIRRGGPRRSRPDEARARSSGPSAPERARRAARRDAIAPPAQGDR